MGNSSVATSIGAVCFGVVIGYITYRTLVRKDGAVLADISGVIAALGGGAIAVWFDQTQGDSFAYYSMGLLVGMVLYYFQFRQTHTDAVAGQYLTIGSPSEGRDKSGVVGGFSRSHRKSEGRAAQSDDVEAAIQEATKG